MSTTGQQENREEEQTSNRDEDHQPSVVSVRSQRSIIRREELKAKEEMAELEERLEQAEADVQRETKEALVALNEAKDKATKMEGAFLKANKTSPEYPDILYDLNSARNDLEMKKFEYASVQKLGGNLIKKIKREMDLLKARRNHEILNLQEEEEDARSQKISDDEDGGSGLFAKPKGASALVHDWKKKNEAIKKAQEESDRKLAEELQQVEDEEAKAKAALEAVQAKVSKLKLKKKSQEDTEDPPNVTKVKGSSVPDSSMELFAKMFARQSSSRHLPEFSGKPEEWPDFISVFRRTTQQCGFSNSENLDRLRKSLKGPALARVQISIHNEDNVPKIIETLEKSFGDPRFIITTMIQKVQKYPAFKERNNNKTIDFGTMVAQLTSTIQVLRCDDHLKNPMLLQELEQKLPTDMQTEWIKWFCSDPSRSRSLLDFSEWLQSEVDIALKLRVPEDFEEKPRNQKSSRDHQKHEPQKRCLTAVNEKTQSKERKCHACEKPGHFAGECRFLQNKNPEEKLKLIKEKRLCAGCLIPGHNLKDCRRKRKCVQTGCEEYHHPVLHRSSSEKTVPSTSEADTRVSNSATGNKSETFLTVLPVILKGPKGEEECLAFVDSGSHFTLIEEELSDRLGLGGRLEPICMQTMNSIRNCEDSRNVSVTLSGTWKGAKQYSISDVRTIDSVPVPALTQDVKVLQEQFPKMRGFPIPSFFHKKPRILLGNGHGQLTSSRRTVDVAEGVSIKRTDLGWGLVGKSGGGSSSSLALACTTYQTTDLLNIATTSGDSVSFLCCENSNDQKLEKLIRDHYSLEDFGVKVMPKRDSVENEKALEIMKSTSVRTPSGRFQTGLLWKDKNVKMPESQKMALHRLRCQEKKMDGDPNFAKEYCAKIDEYLEKGFIRKLNPQERSLKHDKMWYLPHFGVYNPNKPGKMRLVFDAAAKAEGVSLNGVLSPGPDLNQPLVAVLLKFRQFKYAYAGDVKDMFHRVFIQPEDRVAQRFFWRGMQREEPPDVYEMVVMLFGATCSPSSAQFIKNLNADEYAVEYPEASLAIKTNFYVDDFLHSSPTEAGAMKMISDVIAVQNQCSYETRNWISNSKNVNASIPEDYRSKDLKEIGEKKEELPMGRVLGLWWNPESDQFTYRLTMHKVSPEILRRERKPTKRETLRVLMSVFDPLGFLGHLIIKGKIIQQEIWRKEIGWDEPIPDELNDKWNLWMDEVATIENVKIPRCYSINIPTATDIQLHLFCDASEEAYSSVAYFRVESPAGIDVSIVTSRTRVAPLKTISIPRMELMAAVMASRLAEKIVESVDITINDIVFWTDSMTVLKWIRSDSRNFKPFISHRIGEILESVSVRQWRYIPTKENVADDATRCKFPTDLDSDGRWFTGPPFLRKTSDEWPLEKATKDLIVKEEDLEFKATALAVIPVVSNVDFISFAGYHEALWETAQKLKNSDEESSQDSSEISVDELEAARKFLVKECQKESFPEEIRFLNEGKKIDKRSRIFNLEPYLDEEGVLRVTGRLGNSTNGLDANHPAILDQRHCFTTLIIRWYHELCGHQGQRTVASEVRQRYWIVGGMNAIKKIFRDCQKCRMLRGKPGVVKMADLPAVRMEGLIPFYHCGLDYFGPITIKIGRRTEKRWGALFTCLATRAVHLEVAASLTTDSAIMAIQRMSGRRGKPAYLYSDNGTNFHGANVELKKALSEINQEEIKRKLAEYEIQWSFNPPGAPHMGGVWERLVGSVKRAMEGVVNDIHLTDETLLTVLVEVESIINSRPLVELPVDPKDPECLTPNHFLLQRSSAAVNKERKQPVWGEFDRHDLYLRKCWRIGQLLADQFWSRWRKEYLPTLTRRQKWKETKTTVKIGDTVLVVEDGGPRNSWPMGKISSTFPGRDGETRTVEVTTQKGTYRRPITKIVQLDIGEPGEDEASSSRGRMSGCDEDIEEKPASTRPT